MNIVVENKYNRLTIALLFFHFIVNLIWILSNNAPFPWDQASHAQIALRIADYIRSLDLFSIFTASNYYPPLVHIVGSVPLLLFGGEPKLTQIVGTLFFTATIAMVYLYFGLLINNKRIAFFTAFFFSFFPIVYSFSKWLMLDIPVIFFLLLTLYFLQKSDYLTDKKYSLLVFLSASLIIITKWTGVLFLTVPVFVVLWNILKKRQFKPAIVNITFGIIIFLIVSSPWYISNFDSFIFQSKINVIGEQGADPQDLLSTENFTRYINDFINSQTTFYFSAPFFIILTILLFRKWSRKYYILAMIVVNYLIFTFISNKDGRYTMPILPFASFMVAYGLNELTGYKKYLGSFLSIFLACTLFTYYTMLSLRPPAVEGKYISFEIAKIQRFDLVNISDSLVKKYDVNTWALSDALDDMEILSDTKPVKVVVAIEHEHFNPSNFDTYLKFRQYKEKLKNVTTTTPDIYYLHAVYGQDTFRTNKDIEKYLNNVDYVLMSPESLGTKYLRNYSALVMLRNYVIHDSLNFCSLYKSEIAPPDTVCYVDSGEILATESDVLVDARILPEGRKNIYGFSEVLCPYGCSFIEVAQRENVQYPKINIVRSYTLPDGLVINLYKIH